MIQAGASKAVVYTYIYLYFHQQSCTYTSQSTLWLSSEIPKIALELLCQRGPRARKLASTDAWHCDGLQRAHQGHERGGAAGDNMQAVRLVLPGERASELWVGEVPRRGALLHVGECGAVEDDGGPDGRHGRGLAAEAVERAVCSHARRCRSSRRVRHCGLWPFTAPLYDVVHCAHGLAHVRALTWPACLLRSPPSRLPFTPSSTPCICD